MPGGTGLKAAPQPGLMALPRACPRSLRSAARIRRLRVPRTLLLRGEEPPFALRAHEAVDAKRRIAAQVSRLIADGETVLLDSGTTCRAAHACVGPSTLVHTLVTDTTAPADEVAALEGTGAVVKTT
jgi:hypothetical protein